MWSLHLPSNGFTLSICLASRLGIQDWRSAAVGFTHCYMFWKYFCYGLATTTPIPPSRGCTNRELRLNLRISQNDRSNPYMRIYLHMPVHTHCTRASRYFSTVCIYIYIYISIYLSIYLSNRIIPTTLVTECSTFLSGRTGSEDTASNLSPCISYALMLLETEPQGISTISISDPAFRSSYCSSVHSHACLAKSPKKGLKPKGGQPATSVTRWKS